MTTRLRNVPSWAIALAATTAALVAVGLLSVGFFASFGGLAIAGMAAFAAGTLAAAIVDAKQAARNTAVVAFYLVVLAAVYFLLLPALADPQQPGARGGPRVYPPARSGGPGVHPPQR